MQNRLRNCADDGHCNNVEVLELKSGQGTNQIIASYDSLLVNTSPVVVFGAPHRLCIASKTCSGQVEGHQPLEHYILWWFCCLYGLEVVLQHSQCHLSMLL